MILVYWPPHFFTGSSGYFLFANNVLLPGQWHEGGFYSYEAAPGPLNLAFSNSQGKATATGEAVSILLGGANYLAYVGSHRRIGLDINILPEQTHYVQLAHIRGEFALKEVPKEEGERDIQECHWVNSPVK